MELARTLKDSIGREAFVVTRGREEGDRPQPPPMMMLIGVIDNAEEEQLANDDWLVTLSIADTAFLAFSKNHFEGAEEHTRAQEIHIHQGTQLNHPQLRTLARLLALMDGAAP
jgi:hypothetical protein